MPQGWAAGRCCGSLMLAAAGNSSAHNNVLTSEPKEREVPILVLFCRMRTSCAYHI